MGGGGLGQNKTTEKNVWASSNIFPLRGGIFAAYIAFTDLRKKTAGLSYKDNLHWVGS